MTANMEVDALRKPSDDPSPMNTSPTLLSCLIVLAAAVTGCATSTPVAAAPISAEDATKLQAALIGSCHVTGIQNPGGEIKEAKGIHLTFSADGKLHYHIVTLVTVDKDYTYKLDGRNIVSDAMYKNMRVDDFSGKTLKLFIYDITQTYYCTKE